MRKASSATPGNTVLSLRSPYAAGWTNQGRISLPVAQNPSHQCGQRFSKLFKRPQLAGWRVCCRDADVHMDFDHNEDYWGLPSGKHTKKYFTSCDPHHDIYTFCYWQIFWHIFWHSICHISWHFIWHIFWHSIWHSIWHILWHFIWHIFWHSIWHSIWHIFWHSIWPLRSSQVEVQQCTLSWEGPRLRSSGVGRSQVEVQRCPLSWEGPRLRSRGAHWAGKVPGWGPAVHTELGRWRRAWRRVGKATVDVEVEAEVVEMLAEEEQEEQEEDS